MIGEDRTVMTAFEEKLHRLVYEYKQLKERNRELSCTIEEKENTLVELQKHCAALESSYNNLKQAKIISLSENGIEGAKERISKLVREIDRCIESLKKQPE
jgi:chromosome segregation ATPase